MKQISQGNWFLAKFAARKVILAALTVTLIAGFAILPRAARAQDDDSTADTTTQKLTPEQVVNGLATKLNLSDDQKTQITPIIADRQQKLRELAADTSMRPFKKKREMKSVFSDSDKKIEAVLDDSQKQQYKQIEQQMRQQMKDRAQGGNSSN